jgi:hypothetical protein
MPFGLKGSPGTFQRIMSQEVLAGYLRDFCLVYLDDVIVYSKDWASHMYHLRLVLERLQQYNLRCASDKCKIGTTELEFLGHVVSSSGNHPQKLHAISIANFPVPTSRKKLRSFLGLSNWTREYIFRFAEIAAPLTDLLSTKRPFKWNASAQHAMDSIKIAMSRPLSLCRPDFERQFVLQTDASKFGVAAVLYHERPDGGRDIVSYASARFSDAEKRWHSNEQEAFAAVWAIKKYRQYLEGTHFILRTDNKALTWLERVKDERAKLTRWALLLQEFSFTLEHCPGRENELPDFLSRNPAESNITEDIDSLDRGMYPKVSQEGWKADGGFPQVTLIENGLHLRDAEDQQSGKLADRVRGAQRTDPRLSRMINHLERILSAKSPPTNARDKHWLEIYKVIDGYLYRQVSGESAPKLMVPKFMVPHVLNFYHSSRHAGHPGERETLRATRRYFIWPGINRDSKRFVKRCMTCAQARALPSRPRAPLGSSAAQNPFEILAIDLMGPYPRSAKGNTVLLVVTDMFTRWVEAFPMRSGRAPQIVGLLEKEIFSRYGYPRAILSDNGPQFSHESWNSAIDRWQCQHWTTAIYLPRSNVTERRNQELKKGLRVHLLGREHKRWDEHLSSILEAIRGRRNDASGMTPSQALFGYEIKRPGEWSSLVPNGKAERLNRSDINRNIRQNQDHYRSKYAQTNGKVSGYVTGQKVMLREHPLSKRIAGFHAGFAPKYSGPYTVLLPVGRGNVYWIDRKGKPVKVHSDDINLAPDQQEEAQATEP